MEYFSKNKLLDVHPDTLDVVRKAYGLDKPGRIKESIDLLEDWIHKQDHFVKKDFNRDYLEKILAAAKGSVEKTKQRIDRGCTLKTLLPHYFLDVDVKNDFNFWEKMSMAFLPKLTKSHERVYLCGNFNSTGYTTQLLIESQKYIVMLAEYVICHGYVSSYHVVIDCRTPSLYEIMTNISILALRNLAVILIDGYSVRLAGVHIISDSKFADVLLTLVKQVLPRKLDKISNRIYMHKSLESLHEKVEKDVFPVEFGGNERSLKELHEDFLEAISSKEFREYWGEMCKACTDESKRHSGKFNEHYMGMPGSFRSLSVD